MSDLKIEKIMKNVLNVLFLFSSKAYFLNFDVLYQKESESKSRYLNGPPSCLHLCSWHEAVTSELSCEQMGWF